VTVPFELVSGLIVVDCRLNGTPQRFVVDTGASHTIVTAKVARALSLDAGVAEPATARGAGGGVRAAPVTVRSFQWGDEEFADLTLMRVEMDQVCGLVGEDIAGIIGNDLLSRHRLTLDYHARHITLESVPQV